MSKFASANSGGGGHSSFGGFSSAFKKTSNKLIKNSNKIGSSMTVGNSDSEDKSPQTGYLRNTYKKI
jgi:hypothetical protein